MKLKTLLLLIAFSLVVAAWAQAPAPQPAAGQAPAPGQEQQKKQITDPNEYNAYVAALNEQTPARKIQLLDDFLTKFPNTVMKEEALELKMVSQIQAGQNPAATADQLLQANPRNLRALIILSNIFVQTPLSESDPQFQQKLGDAERRARTGLEVLPSFQPPGVNPEDLRKTKEGAEATFREALGVVSMGRKQFEGAQQELHRAAELTPDNAALSYRLGNAYISERPDPKYPAAFWSFARAASLDGPGALPPAGRQQVGDYLRKIYVQYHGSEEGLAQLLAQAKAQPFPPPDFKVMSKAEIAAAKPVEPEKMRFDEIRDMLLAGGPKADELWTKLKGTNMKMPGRVVSATPKLRPRTLRLVVLQETAKKEDAYDVEVNLAAPTTAARAPLGNVVDFSGLVNDFRKDPFVIVMVDGKIGGEEPPAAKKGAKKPAAKKAAKKRR